MKKLVGKIGNLKNFMKIWWQNGKIKKNLLDKIGCKI